MLLLDANILIRYFTNDDPEKARKCESLFKKVSKNKEKVILNHLVIAEVIWVLSGVYDFSCEIISNCLLRVLNTPNIVVPETDLIIMTFSLWEESGYKIDYIDAYNAAWTVSNELEGIYSYDKDFDRIKIPRREP